jgi:hypothetical protein
MDPRNLDKKHEMDLEREKQELALEKAKEKLNQEIKNRLRNDPIIQQLEKEMEDRKRDLKFMEVNNHLCTGIWKKKDGVKLFRS